MTLNPAQVWQLIRGLIGAAGFALVAVALGKFLGFNQIPGDLQQMAILGLACCSAGRVPQ